MEFVSRIQQTCKLFISTVVVGSLERARGITSRALENFLSTSTDSWGADSLHVVCNGYDIMVASNVVVTGTIVSET